MIHAERVVRFLALLTATAAASNSSQVSHLQNVSFPTEFSENLTSDSAIDVQYTSCKVITDRIVATAEGKFSRFCHGICNINETNIRLHRIETLLTSETENIKHRLFYLERFLLDIFNTSKIGSGEGNEPRFVARDTWRLREIDTYNGTVYVVDDVGGDGGGGGKRSGPATVFVYYWRVDSFWRLAFVDGRARSPSFYVSPRGYRMALTVHSDVASRTVRVAAVPAAGEYDAQLRWPFTRRLRLSVLDQTDVAPEDMVSRVWDDNVRCGSPSRRQHLDDGGDEDDHDVCASMEFRHDVLTYRRYLTGDDALLVKLTVFLS